MVVGRNPRNQSCFSDYPGPSKLGAALVYLQLAPAREGHHACPGGAHGQGPVLRPGHHRIALAESWPPQRGERRADLCDVCRHVSSQKYFERRRWFLSRHGGCRQDYCDNKNGRCGGPRSERHTSSFPGAPFDLTPLTGVVQMSFCENVSSHVNDRLTNQFDSHLSSALRASTRICPSPPGPHARPSGRLVCRKI